MVANIVMKLSVEHEVFERLQDGKARSINMDRGDTAIYNDNYEAAVTFCETMKKSYPERVYFVHKRTESTTIIDEMVYESK